MEVANKDAAAWFKKDLLWHRDKSTTCPDQQTVISALSICLNGIRARHAGIHLPSLRVGDGASLGQVTSRYQAYRDEAKQVWDSVRYPESTTSLEL